MSEMTDKEWEALCARLKVRERGRVGVVSKRLGGEEAAEVLLRAPNNNAGLPPELSWDEAHAILDRMRSGKTVKRWLYEAVVWWANYLATDFEDWSTVAINDFISKEADTLEEQIAAGEKVVQQAKKMVKGEIPQTVLDALRRQAEEAVINHYMHWGRPRDIKDYLREAMIREGMLPEFEPLTSPLPIHPMGRKYDVRLERKLIRHRRDPNAVGRAVCFVINAANLDEHKYKIKIVSVEPPQVELNLTKEQEDDQ